MEAQLDYRGRKRSDSQTVNEEPSLTVQGDAAEADINKILKKFAKTGAIGLNEAEAQFLDVSGFTDFADVQRQSKLAEVEFLKLPSKVREIFRHDVANWLDTAHDEDKRAKLVEAGYLEAPKEPEPPEIEKPAAPLAPMEPNKE